MTWNKNCQNCGKTYDKLYKMSAGQWNASKYCTRQCAGRAKQTNDGLTKYQRHRRKNGSLKRGTPELSERISKATILAMKRPDVQEKIRQPRNALTLEHRIKLSNIHAGKMPLNNSYDNSGYSNIQRGHYDINGTTMYFRSKWEANYALYLDFLIDHKEIIKWEYEPDTFMFEQIKLGTRSYTPDFKIYNNNGSHEYHEVKGYMDSKSKTKLKRFKKYYPDERLVLIDSNEYRQLKKRLEKICKWY